MSLQSIDAADLFTSCFEQGASNYWIEDVRTLDLTWSVSLNMFVTASVRLESIDGVHATVGRADLELATQDILDKTVAVGHTTYDQLVEAILAEDSLGIVDAEAADVVLQVAALGDVVYG